MLNQKIWQSKKVLVTGHTGFKGSWLSIWLKLLGTDVIGYALDPYTKDDNFVVTGLEKRISSIIGDVRDYNKLNDVIVKYEPELVFHMAAQPIVRRSYVQPKETYDINVNGTVNLLECCRLSKSVKTIINITSDKCYENMETNKGYVESDKLGGYDPYSSSKACSELVTYAYRNSFFNPSNITDHGKSIASARAGNVIGGGDWAIDRIVPDAIRAFSSKKELKIRNPSSVRPWQHVLDPLYGYILLSEKMYTNPGKFSESWNFGPHDKDSKSVEEVARMLSKLWGDNSRILISKNQEFHEAKLLKLDISKAKKYLDWSPNWNFDTALEKTISWYKNFYNGCDMYQLVCNQIKEYMKIIS